MPASILVLVGFPDTAAHTVLTAAALGDTAPLVLLHFDSVAVVPPPELAVVAVEQAARQEAATMAELQYLTRGRPAETVVVEESGGPLAEVVAAAVAQYRPQLLALGLEASQSLLDELLPQYVLPVLRATHRPLLLVPPGARARRPQRVLIALDGEPFTPTAETLALTPLLAAWQATFVLVHVRPHHTKTAAPERRQQFRRLLSRLLPPGAEPEYYEMSHLSAGSGVVQAITDMRADLVVVLARPRGFLERRFHRSVTAQVLRHSPVPVLLVPGNAADQPGWMPRMC